ncbi:phage regulatory protein/antirepressor Ant [Marinilactibacillus sp. Marseille-P9653]|uniref:phage antirepressor KilAC domain-containing protein n=1 Tax=Marinilactibacillus sp. Marseille-P9653 TaxID=2866583 RepID=UPI001CE459D6|nr:phage regulatory protein/antirepressor Ant [Marinilactibacillus sp. Marseille-P9653]
METMISMTTTQTIESREVAEMIDRKHSELLKYIRRIIGYLAEGEIHSGSFFLESSYFDQNNQPRPCYLLSKQGCEMVANKLTGRNGTIFTAKYVQRFNEMEMTNWDSYMIDDPVKRAEKWIVEQERTKQLALENDEMKPKAAFADSVTASGDTILVRDLARFLKQNGMNIGQNRLFERLRKDGYLIKSGSRKNTPTQKAMDLGLFKTTERTIQRSEGSEIKITTKVTGKGQFYFINKYLEEFNNNEINGD